MLRRAPSWAVELAFETPHEPESRGRRIGQAGIGLVWVACLRTGIVAAVLAKVSSDTARPETWPLSEARPWECCWWSSSRAWRLCDCTECHDPLKMLVSTTSGPGMQRRVPQSQQIAVLRRGHRQIHTRTQAGSSVIDASLSILNSRDVIDASLPMPNSRDVLDARPRQQATAA